MDNPNIVRSIAIENQARIPESELQRFKSNACTQIGEQPKLEGRRQKAKGKRQKVNVLLPSTF
jgi:hypothetical protein